MAPDPDLRRAAEPARTARVGAAGPARRRGPPLGGPLDARPAGVPVAEHARRAAVHRGDVPLRRAPPAASAQRLVGGGGTPATRRPARPRPSRTPGAR